MGVCVECGVVWCGVRHRAVSVSLFSWLPMTAAWQPLDACQGDHCSNKCHCNYV